MPLALTRQNAAYWNVKVLATIPIPSLGDRKIPENLAEFDTWLTDVAAAGYTHPLCFSGKDAWVSSHIVFEDIVPAVAGTAFSKDYWSGLKSGEAPEMLMALEYAKKIAGYISTDWVDMDMGAGINKLMIAEADPAAQCLMTPMGDWGGAILSEKNAPDTDFVGTGWPGTAGNKTVVFGGDTFVAAKGAANQQAVFDFFATMASEKGQVGFNKIKGSMPARSVQDKGGFSGLTLKNMADLEAGVPPGRFQAHRQSRLQVRRPGDQDQRVPDLEGRDGVDHVHEGQLQRPEVAGRFARKYGRRPIGRRPFFCWSARVGPPDEPARPLRAEPSVRNGGKRPGFKTLPFESQFG